MTLTEILLHKLFNWFLGLFGYKRQTPGVRNWFSGLVNAQLDATREANRLTALGLFPQRLFVAMDQVITRRTNGAFALNPGKARVFEHQYQIGVTMNGLSDPKQLTQLEVILEEKLTDLGLAYDVKFATRPLRLVIDKKTVPVQRLSEHLPNIGRKFADNQFYTFAGVCWSETGEKEWYGQDLTNTCGFSTIIFGSSGSGKSQLGAAYLATMMYLNSPEVLSVIIVDPKLQDFVPFNVCPHLALAVTGDIDQAIRVLERLVNEMDKRVEDKANVKRRILFFCDEIADLIAQDEKVLAHLQRLCQKGRSLGLGTLLATQRAVGSGLANVLANISVRSVGRLPSQQESVFAAGVPNVNTSKSRGNGDFLVFSADHDGLQMQGFWFDKPEVICQMIAEKWTGRAAHFTVGPQPQRTRFSKPEMIDRMIQLQQNGALNNNQVRKLHSEIFGAEISGSTANTLLQQFLQG